MKIKPLNLVVNDSWSEIVSSEVNKEYFVELMTFLEAEYKNETIFPPQQDLFSALHYKKPEEIKVVITNPMLDNRTRVLLFFFQPRT